MSKKFYIANNVSGAENGVIIFLGVAMDNHYTSNSTFSESLKTLEELNLTFQNSILILRLYDQI